MNLILNLIIFLISYSILNLVFTLILLAIIMGIFFIMKVVFNMNEQRWDNLFRYKNNIVLMLVMVVCLIISLSITFMISNLFFEFIEFKYKEISSILIILLISLPIIFKFFKLRDYIKSKLTKDPNQKGLFD
ncbi:hypothetical protein [Paraclostridium bifermentans]|uniref:hypothetical protein n=3 Tax=Paraclostridium bifermentans TaxID=1490 RepID=UPI0011591DC9|nr:hypothetical protein [Paraclostridium bifermentans]MCE9676374.1 hypothetical protein [Paraclostridium bifermentans]MDO7204447.1 hypothetical protein [Paraclostridium bifermentans]TQO55905.1 hypothetical protein D5S05_15775 [Paraclostridium bifermentans]GKZ03576.1 hypothetical protein ANS014_20100 [Paraclostridium bifermentans]GKZ07113.1 hypothetical protein ANS015_19960 [Paraclostridium bifermentans]